MKTWEELIECNPARGKKGANFAFSSDVQQRSRTRSISKFVELIGDDGEEKRLALCGTSTWYCFTPTRLPSRHGLLMQFTRKIEKL